VVPGAPRWPGDKPRDAYKPIFIGKRTETSMAANAVSYDVREYKEEVNGIVPGYAGHVPRARDQFGESAVGGLKPDPWTGQRSRGAAAGHSVNAQGQSELAKHSALNQQEAERFGEYESRNAGVMPNYAGHRPGARIVEARSAYSQVTRPGRPGSGYYNVTATSPVQAEYVASVNGVVPGYKGFVPGAIDKCGGSHYGGMTDGDAKMDQDGDFYGLEQKGHGRDHKESMTAGGVKSGYAGHLPGARDTWGVTHYDTVNFGENGRMRGGKRYVNDGIATNNHTNQQKTYHDETSQAFHDA